jgi:Flp pilus assembly protein TadD
MVKSVLTRSRLVAKPSERVETFEEALGMAKNAITQHDWTKAPEYLKRACALDPTQAEPFNLLGVVFELAGDIAEAQRMYEVALALDESYETAQFNLNRTLERARRGHDFKLESEPSENA